MRTVWIYVDTKYHVGHPDHLKVFANPVAADEWFKENDPEGVAFGYEVLGDETRPRSYCSACGALIDTRDLSRSSLMSTIPNRATSQSGAEGKVEMPLHGPRNIRPRGAVVSAAPRRYGFASSATRS